MKYKWLHRGVNIRVNIGVNGGVNDLIIFFNGWGMDENIIKHLDTTGYDILMFYDYNSLDTDFDFSFLNIYQKKYLVAWSMGVMISSLFDIDYTKKIAINGTLKPIDDKFGIPKRIYNLTLKGFSPKGAKQFIKTMFLEECELPIINREFESIKSELEALTHYSAKENFKYDRIILSSDDKIIPTKNQVAYWGIEPNIKSGHAPFYKFSKWSDLL